VKLISYYDFNLQSPAGSWCWALFSCTSLNLYVLFIKCAQITCFLKSFCLSYCIAIHISLQASIRYMHCRYFLLSCGLTVHLFKVSSEDQAFLICFVLLFSVLGIEPQDSWILCRHSITVLHPQLQKF
jgi:hypothetical protein